MPNLESSTNLEPDHLQTKTTPAGDLVGQLMVANTLEQDGEITQAILIYQNILFKDPAGVYGEMALKALENLGVLPEDTSTKPVTPEEVQGWVSLPVRESQEISVPTSPPPVSLSTPPPQSSFSQWFQDLPLPKKQWFFLGIFELIVLGLVGSASFMIQRGLSEQLQDQATVELALLEEKYQAGDPTLEQTTSVFGGYSALYQASESGQWTLRQSQLQESEQSLRANVPLPSDLLLLKQASQNPQKSRLLISGQWYAIAAKAVSPETLLIRGIPEKRISQLVQETRWGLLGLWVGIVVIHSLLLMQWNRSLVWPLRELIETAQSMAKGNRNVRSTVLSQDEMGSLAEAINSLANSMTVTERALAAEVQERQLEAEQQRSLRERLEQGVINLLLDIEEAQRGNLTVQARVVEGEIGSIADALNATLLSLKQLVSHVKLVTQRVNKLANMSAERAEALSPNALVQAAELDQALLLVQENTLSIQSVAQSAQEAAQIARTGSEVVQISSRTMDQTVESMEKIRVTAADTAKLVKRLAEASQEISQVVAIITGVADKTNLLAFNAALEAARAGEYGQGFRQISDEIRRLALQVTDFSQEIGQLIGGVQQETAEVIRGMELNTSEVVIGTRLINETKNSLKELVTINQQIDDYLKTISQATQAQTNASQRVNRTIAVVAGIAQDTSNEAQQIVTALQELVQEVQALQQSVSRFQIGE
jgi:twitching motility protein PilJ